MSSHPSDSILYRSFVHRCQNRPDIDEFSTNLSLGLNFSAAAFIYGGLHALAWFAHFDSSTEQLLWRISACVVMGMLPVIIGLYSFSWRLFVWETTYRTQKKLEKVIESRSLSLIEDLADIMTYILMLAYVLARAYLVVECFINIAHLPAGVYDVPTWSAYFPHIS